MWWKMKVIDRSPRSPTALDFKGRWAAARAWKGMREDKERKAQRRRKA